MKKSSTMYLIMGVTTLILIALIFGFFALRNQTIQEKNEKSIAIGTQKLADAENSKVTDAESQIDAILEQERKAEEEKRKKEQALQQKKNASKPFTKKEIKTTLKNCVFVGDSLMEGLTTYQFLTNSNVVYKRGMSVPNASELFPTIVGLNPDHVFLSFGMNDLLYFRGNSSDFITAYQKQITTLQKKLPDSKIYVLSILPIQKRAIEKNKNFNHYKDFNKSLGAMCEKIKITFIDCTALANKHVDLFEQDGLHVKSTFYPYWLKEIANKAGLL